MNQHSEQAPKKGIKTFYISTIFSISLVLLMVGLLGLIVLHGKNLSNFVKENIVLNIILDEEARDADIFKLQKEIEKNDALNLPNTLAKN
jgi:cell division transport system permease protein